MTYLKGMVAGIQRCSLHDGPGIRTTVFLKGCNLKCDWCHNPETIGFEPEILLHPEKCIHCGLCDQGCFSGAREVCGQEMTVDALLNEVMKDSAYYAGEGGVTVSGGEPSCQSAFVSALFERLKAHGVHTAVETNLFCNARTLKTMLCDCDLVMADLKLFDNEKHKQFTGAGNEIMLENLRRVPKPMIVRTPVIAGINDTPDEIAAIAHFCAGCASLWYYELLPYHALGMSKGAANQKRFSAPDKEKMRELAHAAGACGIDVRIAGRK